VFDLSRLGSFLDIWRPKDSRKKKFQTANCQDVTPLERAKQSSILPASILWRAPEEVAKKIGEK